MRKSSIGMLIISLLMPLLIGAFSAMLSSEGMSMYATMRKPPLSPPAWAFPVAWTILYLMMGLASYYVITSTGESGNKNVAITLYLVQLAMNFLWPIVFFNWGMYLLAFIWLMALWCVVIVCAIKFCAIDKMAGCLLIPYILWLTFAAYLNFGTYFLAMKSR